MTAPVDQPFVNGSETLSRREFVGRVVGAGALAALTGSLLAQTEAPKPPADWEELSKINLPPELQEPEPEPEPERGARTRSRNPNPP